MERTYSSWRLRELKTCIEHKYALKRYEPNICTSWTCNCMFDNSIGTNFMYLYINFTWNCPRCLKKIPLLKLLNGCGTGGLVIICPSILITCDACICDWFIMLCVMRWWLVICCNVWCLLTCVDGWMNQAYSRLSTTHGHITDCKLLVCMYWTRLELTCVVW